MAGCGGTASGLFLRCEMVYLFFGLPGCGKTTLMVQRIIKYHKRFPNRNIYCNVGLSLPYVTFIKNSDVGLFNLHDGILNESNIR